MSTVFSIRFVFFLVLFIYKEAQCTLLKRIIGGENTDIGKAPYMLSMRLNNHHICGAVIIGKSWSLTAAHCCLYPSGKRLKLQTMMSGSAKLDAPGRIHRIIQIVRHFKYVDIDDDYDICAVRVESPGFDVSRNVLAVKLAPINGMIYDNEATFSGWGYYEADSEKLSLVLQSINVTKVELYRCRYLYRFKYNVHDSNVCYMTKNKGTDACDGDSGGALVNKDFVLIGIMSFGDDCSYSTLPGVYTEIRQFRGWIKLITGL